VNCKNNTLTNGSYNTFGYGCCNNTLLFDCNSNTFDAHCRKNKLTFASSNTLGSSCIANDLANYTVSVRFANKCSYIKLATPEQSGSDNHYVRNVTVGHGVSGTEANPLTLNVSRNAPPVVYEAAGTTHIILD
jgi:hypothetical protein